jgi:hypothetical protein
MDNMSKSGGMAGMNKPPSNESNGWANKGMSGANKPATPQSGANSKNPHIGSGRGERIKGGDFAGV